MIDRAYALAYFILRRRDLALRATEEAAGRLEVAMASQDKRLYYGRAGPGRASGRGRVWLEEAHQLQRLVYVACEPHERERERAGPDGGLTEEDLILHFVKHLARITVRRNAFHVVLGFCRLLFSYSTAEAMEIHNQLVDRPEDVKDDSYYRARKALLMDELAERFYGLLAVVRHQRGEERFQARDDSRPCLPFVAECLERFTPWDTPCWPDAQAAPSRADADAELRRIHASLHPACLQRLVDSLRLAALESRLALPRFSLSPPGDEDPMPPHRRETPPLGPEERQQIERALDRSARARSRAGLLVLRIVVDGREQGRLDPVADDEVSLTAAEDAEVLEVWAGERGEGVLLATALLGSEGALSITLEAGQRLTARIGPAADRSRRIALAYRETRRRRAFVRAGRRAGRRLAAAMGRPRRDWRLGWSALAVALVAAAAVQLSRWPPELAVDPTDSRERVALPAPSDRVSPRSGVPIRKVVRDLHAVRTVFIEVKGERAPEDAVARRVAAGLRSSRFTLVTEKDGADAVLKIELASPPARVVARLVNVDGEILWPPGLERGGREVQGPPAASVERILRQFLAESNAPGPR